MVRRIGGGFGGKETNFMTSSICALLSLKTKKPVKLRLDRDEDIIITGKRHEFYSEYEVGKDEFEAKHPQLRSPRVGADPQALRDPRPETGLGSQRSRRRLDAEAPAQLGRRILRIY